MTMTELSYYMNVCLLLKVTFLYAMYSLLQQEKSSLKNVETSLAGQNIENLLRLACKKYYSLP